MIHEFDVKVAVRLNDAGEPVWSLTATTDAGNVVARGEGPTIAEAEAALTGELRS